MNNTPSYSISRQHGVTTVTVPGRCKDKATVIVADQFAYLLPRNCPPVDGPTFAKLIAKHNTSDQAKAVCQALNQFVQDARC